MDYYSPPLETPIDMKMHKTRQEILEILQFYLHLDWRDKVGANIQRDLLRERQS